MKVKSILLFFFSGIFAMSFFFSQPVTTSLASANAARKNPNKGFRFSLNTNTHKKALKKGTQPTNNPQTPNEVDALVNELAKIGATVNVNQTANSTTEYVVNANVGGVSYTVTHGSASTYTLSYFDPTGTVFLPMNSPQDVANEIQRPK